MSKKVVLAFSGGLDTSYCVKYLTQEHGYEVHTALVDTGGFSEEEREKIAERAHMLGVSSHVVLDETYTFYEECLRFLIFGNVLRYQTYPLSVSAERVFQALAVARYAKEIGAEAVAHGSTGAGNDQVRFDLVFEVLAPDLEVITPIREKRLSREDEVSYLKAAGIDWDWKKAQYSINQGLWGTSVGGKETLNSWDNLPEEAYPSQVTTDTNREVILKFEQGELMEVDGEKFEHPVGAILKVAELTSPYGIGRDTHVGDTIIGIKGRVGFEAAAPMVIIKAHQLLEKHVLTKWQMYWKDQLANWYGMMLHEGQYLDPVLRNIETFMQDSQARVTGEVRVLLAPYRYQVLGCRSDFDLMSAKFGTYGEVNRAWSGDDVKGFTKILSVPGKLYNAVGENED